MNQSAVSRLPRHPRGPITVIPRINPHQSLQQNIIPPLDDSASKSSNDNQDSYIEECKQLKINKIQEMQDLIFTQEQNIETNPKELLHIIHSELKDGSSARIQETNTEQSDSHVQHQIESLKKELKVANSTIDELKSQIAEQNEIINKYQQKNSKHKPKEPSRPHTTESPGFSSNPRHFSPSKTSHIQQTNQIRQEEANE